MSTSCPCKSAKLRIDSEKPSTPSARPTAATASSVTNSSRLKSSKCCASHNSKSSSTSANGKSTSCSATGGTGQKKCSTKSSNKTGCSKRTKGSKYGSGSIQSMASQSLTKSLASKSRLTESGSTGSSAARDEKRIKFKGGYILAEASISQTVDATERSFAHSKKSATLTNHSHSCAR